MYTKKDKKGHIQISLTLTFKFNCRAQAIDFVFLDPLFRESYKRHRNLVFTYTQPAIGNFIIVYIYDLGFEGQPSSDLFQFARDF